MKPHQQYIDDLIEDGESYCQDFKYHVSTARKIAKTLVAFANTFGGKLLIGVKDNGKVIGIESDEERYMIETAARYYCHPQVNFTIQDWIYDGKTVLEVNIPQSTQKPHYVKDEDEKWWVYVRVNDKNKFANRVVIEFLKRKQNEKSTFIQYSKKENLLLDFLNANNQITIKKFVKIARLKPRIAENILINLSAIGVIQINHNEKHFYYTLRTNESRKNPESLFWA